MTPRQTDHPGMRVIVASEVQLVPGDTVANGSRYVIKLFPGIFHVWQQLQDGSRAISQLTLQGSEHNG